MSFPRFRTPIAGLLATLLAIGGVGLTTVAAEAASVAGTVRFTDGSSVSGGEITDDETATNIPGVTYSMGFRSVVTSSYLPNSYAVFSGSTSHVVLTNGSEPSEFVIRSGSVPFGLTTFYVADFDESGPSYTASGYLGATLVGTQTFTIPQRDEYDATITLNRGFSRVDRVVVSAAGGVGGTGLFDEGFGDLQFADPASTNAALSGLAPSAGSLAPAFAPATTAYAMTLPSTIPSISLTPSVADAGATVTVQGLPVAAGHASAPILIETDEGGGTFPIVTVVTAADGRTKSTYTTTVTVSDTALSSLSVSTGTLTPAFTPGASAYTAQVGEATTSITVTPVVINSTASVSVNGTTRASGSPVAVALAYGHNAVTVTVTSAAGLTGTYAIDVTRLAPVPAATVTLSDYRLSAGEQTAVTVQFATPVTGFTAGNLTTPRGALSNFVTSDYTTFTAVLTPPDETNAGTNVVTLNYAGVVTSFGGIGAGSTASSNFTINTVRPTATIEVAWTSLHINGTSPVTVTFNEPVSGISADILTVEGATLSAATTLDNTVFTATLAPNASLTAPSNTITLDLSGVISLEAGNRGTGVARSNSYAVDTVRPTATVIVSPTALGLGATALVSIAFSEPVNGLTTADIETGTASLSNLSTTDYVNFTAILTPGADTGVAGASIRLDLSGVADSFGNAGAGTSESNSYRVDTVAPTATVSLDSTDLRAGETATLTITFTESVLGLDASDLALAGGSIGALASADGGITFTATYTPPTGTTSAASAITLDARGVTDSVGNAGAGVSSTGSFSVNTVVPTLSALALSSGDLAPGFDPTTAGYTAAVGNATTSITVTPTTTDATASITVNGATVASGLASAPVPLAVGDTTITVVVASRSGTATTTYTVVVSRAALPPAIATTTLGELRAGTAYIGGVTATGSPTLHYAVTAGALPQGLALNVITGSIAGTPTTAGAYDVTIEASSPYGIATAHLVGSVLAERVVDLSLGFAAGTPIARATVGIHLTGADQGTAVSLDLYSTPVNLYSAAVDASGTLDATVALPASFEAGAHRLELTVTGPTGLSTVETVWFTLQGSGIISAVTRTGPLTYTADAATPTALAATGFDGSVLALLAALLLALGAVLVARRRATRIE